MQWLLLLVSLAYYAACEPAFQAKLTRTQGDKADFSIAEQDFATGLHPTMCDRNRKTSHWFRADDTQAFAAIEMGAFYDLSKVGIYLNEDGGRWKNHKFSVFVGDHWDLCNFKESLDRSIPIAEDLYFSNAAEMLTLDLKGVVGSYLIIGIGKPYGFEFIGKVPEVPITEVYLVGKPMQPTPITVPFEVPASPEQVDFGAEAESYKKYTKPEFPAAIKAPVWSEEMLPKSVKTACLYAYEDSCSVVVGTYGKGTFAISTNSYLWNDLWMAKRDYRSEEYVRSVICNGCVGLMTELPDKADPSKVLALSQAKTPKFDVKRILDLLSEGQGMDILVKNSEAGTPEVEELIAKLGVSRSTKYCMNKPYVPGTNVVPSDLQGLYPMVDLSNSDPLKLTGLHFYYKHALKQRSLADEYFTLEQLAPCQGRHLGRGAQRDYYYKKFVEFEKLDGSRPKVYPGIRIWPPPVDPQAPKATVVINLNGIAQNRFFSSGVGVEGNSWFKYRVVEGDPSLWRMRFACSTDSLYHLPALKRLASNYQDFGVLKGSGELYALFTGLLYLVPAKSAPAGKPYKLVIEFSGVYRSGIWNMRAPDTIELWNRTKERTYFGHVELTGDALTHCLRTFFVYKANPSKEVGIYRSVEIQDQFAKNQFTTTGWPDGGWLSVGLQLNYDLQISGGAGHNGHPLQGHEDWINVNGASVEKYGAWGVCHEMGHNLNPGRSVLTGCVEVTNNVLCHANYNVTGASFGGYRPGTRFWDQNAMFRQFNNQKWPWPEYGARMMSYIYPTWQLGTGFMANVFWHIAHYGNKYGVRTNEEALTLAACDVTGYNMCPFYSLFAFPIAQKTKDLCAKFKECWLPKEPFYYANIKANIAAVEKAYNMNCTAETKLVAHKYDPKYGFDRNYEFMEAMPAEVSE